MAVIMRIGEGSKFSTDGIEYWDVIPQPDPQQDAPQFQHHADGGNCIRFNNSIMLTFLFRYPELDFFTERHPNYIINNSMCHCVVIDQTIVDLVDSLYHQNQGPLPPGFGYSTNNDPAFAILIWLHWWSRWAIQNCAVPLLCY